MNKHLILLNMYTTKALSLKRVGAIAALMVLGLSLLLTQAISANASVAAISNYSVAPVTFNPDLQPLIINFDINKSGKVGLEVSKDTEVIKSIAHMKDVVPGNQNFEWDGTDRYGEQMAEGSYWVRLIYYGSDFTLFKNTKVTVDYNAPYVDPNGGNNGGNNGGTTDVITSDYVNPNPFNPTQETARIYFTLNESVDYLDVKIKNGSNTIATLINHQSKNAGTYYVAWNGKDTFGDYVDEGPYSYEIVVGGSFGTETELGNVDVDYEGNPPNNGGNNGGDTVVIPNITNAYVSPEIIDPSKGETMTIYYTLNTCTYVKVNVYDPSNNNAHVAELQDWTYQCEGVHNVVWNGKNDNNQIMHNGDYKITIDANNSKGSDEEVEFVEVTDDNGGGNNNGNLPDVYDLSLNRDVFDPYDQTVTLTYKLDECSDVTIKIYDEDDNYVNTLLNSVEKCTGTHTVTWDGEDSSNDEVDDGDYYFKVYALNDYGSDSEKEYVEADSGSNNNNGDEDPEITNVDVNPDVFNPYHEDTELEFKLNTCADVTIEVRDEDNDVVYTIIDDKRLCDGTHRYDWDGEDEDNDYVREDNYEFYIRAENDEGTDTARADVEVDYDGYTYNSGERCSNYLDVSTSDKYCDAIEYVTGRGIFDGYPDGTFKPYQAINRAETSKVIIKGFDYPILSPDGTNLGFWDLLPEAWYIPYIKTGKAYGILQGYPDGSFQPARTVNRVELLKIFLESANVALPTCNTAPYVDTPKQADTEWYIPYVCYAKMNNLMDTDYYGHFNPDKPMTRGDVAELFYRFANRDYNTDYNTDYYDDYYYNNNNTYGTVAKLSNVELSDDEVERGDALTIYYDLNVRSEVTIEILDDDGDVVREIIDDFAQSAGRLSARFNGEDDDGDDLRLGDYTVRIVARNYYGSDKEEVDFEVVEDAGGSNDNYRDTNKLVDIYDIDLDPDEFDPDTEETELSFRLSRTAEVTVKVYDEDNHLVLRLIDEEDLRGGYQSVSWDGDDKNGDQVDDGDYRIVIQADSSLGSDEEEIYVEVNS